MFRLEHSQTKMLTCFLFCTPPTRKPQSNADASSLLILLPNWSPFCLIDVFAWAWCQKGTKQLFVILTLSAFRESRPRTSLRHTFAIRNRRLQKALKGAQHFKKYLTACSSPCHQQCVIASKWVVGDIGSDWMTH